MSESGWAELPAHTRRKGMHYFPAGETGSLCKKAYLQDGSTPRSPDLPGSTQTCSLCLEKLEELAGYRARTDQDKRNRLANTRRMCVGCASWGSTKLAGPQTPLLASASPPLCHGCVDKYSRRSDYEVVCKTCGSVLNDRTRLTAHEPGCKAVEKRCTRCDSRPAGKWICTTCKVANQRAFNADHGSAAALGDKPRSRLDDYDNPSWDNAVRCIEDQ